MGKWYDVKYYKRYCRYCAPQTFIDANEFTKASTFFGDGDLYKILKTGTFASANFGDRGAKNEIPYRDHLLIFKNPKSKTCCLVYIPYYKASDIKKEVEEWAETLGLKADVYDESWYNENTCTIFVHLPNVEIKGIKETMAKCCNSKAKAE